MPRSRAPPRLAGFGRGPGLGDPGVGARLAERCLAERAELSLDALRRCLLDLDDGAS